MTSRHELDALIDLIRAESDEIGNHQRDLDALLDSLAAAIAWTSDDLDAAGVTGSPAGDTDRAAGEDTGRHTPTSR